MSAFICSDKHTAVLAVAIFEILTTRKYYSRNEILVHYGEHNNRQSVDICSVQMLADFLRVENVMSVDNRYSQDNVIERVKITDETKRIGLELARNKDKWNVLNSIIACYNYQTCEHKEYKISIPYNILRMCREEMLNRLVGESEVWEYN